MGAEARVSNAHDIHGPRIAYTTICRFMAIDPTYVPKRDGKHSSRARVCDVMNVMYFFILTVHRLGVEYDHTGGGPPANTATTRNALHCIHTHPAAFIATIMPRKCPLVPLLSAFECNGCAPSDHLHGRSVNEAGHHITVRRSRELSTARLLLTMAPVSTVADVALVPHAV
jgi:hypothetical protein